MRQNDGERVDLVFTTADGGIVARQHIDKLVRSRAAALGIDTVGLGTHVGRRTVVTAMSEHGVALDDIARHVGCDAQPRGRGLNVRALHPSGRDGGSGDYPTELIVAVEQELLSAGSTPNVQLLTSETRGRFGDDALVAYLAATTNEPSLAALKRFVVYAVNRTTTRQSVLFVDTDRLGRAAISRFLSDPTVRGMFQVHVASDDPVAISRDDCATLD